MSELRRWSEEGATLSERALLEASRREQAPRSARARALGTLGAGVTVLASTSSASTATAASAALLTKVVAVTLLVSGATAGGVAWHEAARPPPNTARTTHNAPGSRTPASISVAAALPPAVVPSATAPEEPGPVARASRIPAAKAHPLPVAPGTLTLEVDALERARDALVARDFDAATRALDGYKACFPRGELASEETVLRVETLLARGDRVAATAMAEAFSATHPANSYARQVKRLVRDAERDGWEAPSKALEKER